MRIKQNEREKVHGHVVLSLSDQYSVVYEGMQYPTRSEIYQVRDIQLLPEVELEWVSKHIGALSVWCYNLVYVYILSMKVDT